MNIALKEQYLSLTKDEKRTVRKGKLWRTVSVVTSSVIFFSCIAVGIYLLMLIPKPSAAGWALLYHIGMVLLGFGLLIVSFLLACGITLPLWKQVEKINLPAVKKDIFPKVCAHLREYYQLQEPYIITKCFNSTDENFTNHDVCIFVVGDELRITTDLVHGFLHGYRDLGCYVFNKENICVSKKQEGKYLIAELKTESITFLLGYRAKGFIDKYLSDKLKSIRSDESNKRKAFR